MIDINYNYDNCPDDIYLDMKCTCSLCGEAFNLGIELFKRYGDNFLCPSCDREEFEDETSL